MNQPTKTAVLVVAFRRPDCVEQVIRAIRAARPERMYLAFDAPRLGRSDEAAACTRTREIATTLIDWPCELHVTHAETNLGCHVRVPSAIDWVFKREERVMIFEDDCVPHRDFFPFTDELLERYAKDERVAMISGSQFVPGGWNSGTASYSFTRLAQIWGWATWRRAWRHFEHSVKDWPHERRGGKLLRQTFPHRRDRTYWRKRFDNLNEFACWDYQWCLTRWQRQQVAIMPAVNLCQNIGFRPDATHTFEVNHPAAAVPLAPMLFPLRHPTNLILDDALDAKTARLLFYEGDWFSYHWDKLLRRLRLR